jgi:hypothetical protein
LYVGNHLRIGGNDSTNTIYSPTTNNIGITLNHATNSGGSINLGFNGGNGNILSITNTTATVSQNLIVNTRIGIGTNNPLSTLHVNAGAILKVIALYDLGNNFQYTGFGATSGLIHNIPSTTDAFQFRVGTSSTTANEVMRITGVGNVCVGTTTAQSTATLLTVSGSSTGAGQPIVQITQNATWNGANKNFAFQVSGYANLGGLRLNGIDSANTILQENANTDIGIITNSGNIILNTNGATKFIKFFTNGANERMIIDSNGNVGIGSSTPQSKLSIEGVVQIAGAGSYTKLSVDNR